MDNQRRRSRATGGARSTQRSSVEPLNPFALSSALRRIRWALVMWLPNIILMLWRKNEATETIEKLLAKHAPAPFEALALAVAEDSVHPDYATAAAVVMVGYFAAIFFVCIVNELFFHRNSVNFAVSFCNGLVIGGVRHGFDDLRAARLVVKAAYGIAAGQLQYHYTMLYCALMPESTIHQAPSSTAAGGLPSLVLWFVRNKVIVLYSTWLVCGELVGCLMFVPDGWKHVVSAAYGYVLVVCLPYTTYIVSRSLSFALIKLFGSDKNAIQNSSRLSFFYWVATTVLSLVTLFGVVGAFVVKMVPYVWRQQAFMAPYAIVLESASHESRASMYESKANPYAYIETQYAEHIQRVRKEYKGKGLH